MKIRRGWGRTPGGAGWIARLLTAAAAMLLAVALVDLYIRPVIQDMIATQARQFAFREINTAMLRELEENGVDYGDLVRVEVGEDGLVRSIQTDAMAVNRLKARLSDAVTRQVDGLGEKTVRVPVGTLLGGHLFAGRGPRLTIRVLPVGVTRSELTNQFTDAGVNQTLHRIMLETTVEVVALLPGYRVKTQASNSFCVAETVVVGSVPEGYTVVDGDSRSILPKINDYRAYGNSQ